MANIFTDVNLDMSAIAVVGLGYVGLPLAVEFGKRRRVVGFDTDRYLINTLRNGEDRNGEVSEKDLAQAKLLSFSASEADLRDCNIYIVAVPTPIDASKRPDLGPLLAASRTVGNVLGRGDCVIYESTVYPGATENDCVPVLEEISQLVFNKDFFVGYSPERINPGDTQHSLTKITKVTSGSTPEIADFVDRLYGSIIEVGTYKAESILVAEAAKVIENTQRDLNIALMNELAIIFDKLNIATDEVLRAAETKWNFLPFRPGLVGGHCIGVDPYYLTHKAEQLGYKSEVILAGRRLNDSMGSYVALRTIHAMVDQDIQISAAKVLILGLSFKENCSDVRNTRVIDLIAELQKFGVGVDVYDPLVDLEVARCEFGVELVQLLGAKTYDGVIVAVAHDVFRDRGTELFQHALKPNNIIFDLKSILPKEVTDLRL